MADERLAFYKRENECLNRHKGELIDKVWTLESELKTAKEFADFRLKYSEQLSTELTIAWAKIEQLRKALEAITAHRVNHFITKDAMVASMFETAKEALQNGD